MIMPMMVDFFCCSLMLLGVKGRDLIIPGQIQGSEISPGLFQDFMEGYMKFLKLLQLLVELRVLSKGISTQQFSNLRF